jgi:transaldolase
VGAYPQRLLWASTGTKDPNASSTLYVESLEAPDTIDTMPQETLHAFAQHGTLEGSMAADGGDAESVLGSFAGAGVDIQGLAIQLQHEGTQSFFKSWPRLLLRIATKTTELASIH